MGKTWHLSKLGKKVNFHTLIRLECGSVHTKLASINFILERFFSLFKQSAISSRDSKVHVTQYAGGFRYLKNKNKYPIPIIFR